MRGFWTVFAALLVAVSWGQGTTPVYPANPVTTPPVIDGDINPSEWANAAHGEGFADADTNLASDEKAEWWLTYDGEFIYFAGRVYTDPNQIVADEYRPNVGLRGNDAFTLLLDLGGNGSSQDSFGVNAQGATSINLSGGRAAKIEWVGEFDARGRRTETGWQVEARIPWQIVTPVPQGPRNARFNFVWYRSNRSNTYVHYYTQRNAARDPVWENVVVPVIRGQRGVSLLPYAFAGVDDYGHLISRSGVDLKHNLPGGLNLVGTINPDDVNIEADVLGLDFSYFERLPDEVRPFFLEGNRYIRTGFDARLFASQRMPSVTAGIKVYGDSDQRTQIGVMSVADFGDRAAHVVSMSQRLNARQSYQFGYVRYDETGATNDGFMLNFNQQLGGTGYYLNTQFTNDSIRETGTRFSTGFNHQAGGLSFGAGYDEVTPNFFPRVGFTRDRDYRSLFLFSKLDQQYQGGPNLQTEWQVSTNRAWRVNGADYREGLSGSINILMRNGLAYGIGASWSEFLQNEDRSLSVGIAYPFNDPYRNFQLRYSRGYFAGDDRDQWEFSVRMRPTPRTQVVLSSEFVAYRGHQTQQIFAVSHDLSKFEGIAMRLIRRDNDYNWSASYRLSGRRGNELFFIIGDPNARSFQRRLALKFVMPVTIGG